MKRKIKKECNNCYYALDCFMRYVLKSGVCKFYITEKKVNEKKQK